MNFKQALINLLLLITFCGYFYVAFYEAPLVYTCDDYRTGIVYEEVRPEAFDELSQDLVELTLEKINVMSEEELKTLDGIGEVIAKNIVAYRRLYGPFIERDELLLVSGIGPYKLKSIFGDKH